MLLLGALNIGSTVWIHHNPEILILIFPHDSLPGVILNCCEMAEATPFRIRAHCKQVLPRLDIEPSGFTRIETPCTDTVQTERKEASAA